MNTPYVMGEVEETFNRINLQKCMFIGSLGFEDRSLGAVRKLKNKNIVNDAFFLITHSSSTDTKGHQERLVKQQINQKDLKDLFTVKKQLHLLDCSIDSPQSAFDEIVYQLKKDQTIETLVFDFSTMPKSIMFPLIKLLLVTLKFINIFALYSVPSEYTFEPLFYEVGKPKILSGFQGKLEDKNLPNAWIPILGFEGNTALAIIKSGEYEKVLPIIAFPGYHAGYVDRVLHANREVLVCPEVERAYFASANNPFRTYELISKLLKRLCDYNVVLSPLGPKPHSLGICLAAINQNLRVIYAQPWSYNPNYSIGYKMTYAYWIQRIEEGEVKE